MRAGCGAAVSITVENEERVVVVQEADRGLDQSDAEVVIEIIRGAVAQEHEVFLHDVVLIRAGSIPKTSSGKIQRHACREAYIAGTLEVIARSVSDTSADEFAGEADLEHADLDHADFGVLYTSERRKLVEDFLKSESARILRVARSRLNAHESLVSMGLDSLGAVELKHAVEEHLGVSISLAALLDDASITQVADEILKEPKSTLHEKLLAAGPVHEVAAHLRPAWSLVRATTRAGEWRLSHSGSHSD